MYSCTKPPTDRYSSTRVRRARDVARHVSRRRERRHRLRSIERLLARSNVSRGAREDDEDDDESSVEFEREDSETRVRGVRARARARMGDERRRRVRVRVVARGRGPRARGRGGARGARVAEARATLDGVDARDAVPLPEISSLLNADAVKRLEKNAVVIDAAVVREPLAEEERLAWRDVRDEEWLTTRSTTTLPMAKRPNDFLCAVFSCYNDPRAPPSTDALLSLRLTRDGVRMGARGDSRITAVGLAASLDDALEKLDALLALVDDV